MASCTGLSLCAGIGGLDLGLGLAVDGYRVVGYVERESYAASALVARMEDSTLDRAPIWDDLETFDGIPWFGRVDLVSAGFPCQPFSTAGKRLGARDERWLWDHIVRILREVEPRLVFLENVPPLVARGLDRVLGTLAELGFDAEWDVFSAAGVGAPHRRRRLFVVARRVSDPLGLCLRNESERGQGGSQAAECRDTEYVHLGETVGDSDCGGLEGERIAQHSGQGTLGDEPERSDYDGQLLWPPGPSDSEGWRSYIADGGAEPSIRRGSDGNAARMERLHALGNAVVPLVAAHAFQTLWTRF